MAALDGAEFLTLHELHGVIQVTMGSDGIQFCLRAKGLGSSELSASSSDVRLTSLQLRRGTRFTYDVSKRQTGAHPRSLCS